MAEVRITKNFWIPFLDIGAPEATAADWGRIDKSTVFEIAANPQTEDVDFINQEAAQTELRYYKPTMDQEIACYRGNPMYDFLAPMFFRLKVEEAVIPCLVVFPKLTDAATSAPAWLYDEALVVFNTLSSTDGKIAFTINFNGEKQLGTVVVTDGKPVFTQDAA